MINETEVYKIKYISLRENDCLGQVAWVHGYNVMPKTGGSGKTFTSKKLVNRMFKNMRSSSTYNVTYRCEIVTFKLTELSVSDGEI